jgi:outer membrane protein assembly factor BamB
MHFRRTAAVAALLLATTTLAAADWPQWQGPNRDGKSEETGLLQSWSKDGPPLAWKINLGGYGYSSPSIVGDRLYITGSEKADGSKEFALCLNTKDGKQIWKSPLPSGKYGGKDRGPGPRSSATVDGEVLYTVGPAGDLTCLKTADGSKVWSVNFVKDLGGNSGSWGYSESVLIDGDKLICTPGGKRGSMVALDKKTGKELWRSKELTDAAHYCSVIVADIAEVRQYITQTNAGPAGGRNDPGAAVGVRASDGKLLWRFNELKRRTAVIPTPVVQDNYVFFTAGYGAGCELVKIEPAGKDEVKASLVYTKKPLFANHHGGVIRVGEYIYGHSDSGGWTCLEFKRGGDEPEWQERKALGKGSVTYADGHLYCYSEREGTCVLVEASPGGWKEKGRFTIPEKMDPRPGGQIWTHPVVANGKLYLRDHLHLFCYDVAAKK